MRSNRKGGRPGWRAIHIGFAPPARRHPHTTPTTFPFPPSQNECTSLYSLDSTAPTVRRPTPGREEHLCPRKHERGTRNECVRVPARRRARRRRRETGKVGSLRGVESRRAQTTLHPTGLATAQQPPTKGKDARLRGLLIFVPAGLRQRVSSSTGRLEHKPKVPPQASRLRRLSQLRGRWKACRAPCRGVSAGSGPF